MYYTALDENWLLRSENLEVGPEMVSVILEREADWMKANVPCDVHMPLIENGIIKDPVEADNCYRCEWIEDKSWWFKKSFIIGKESKESDILELVIESMDSEGDVFLNGLHLGHQRGCFYPFTKNIKPYLKDGENVLLIRVSSGMEYYSEKDISKYKKFCYQHDIPNRRGEARRPFVRKPSYVYGWDFHPRIATCGIMGKVAINAYNGIVIRDVHIKTISALKDAVLEFGIELESLKRVATTDATVNINILYEGKTVKSVSEEVFLFSGINFIDLKTMIEDAKLWWPNGMGKQALYTVKVSVECGEVYESFKPIRYGIRTLKLNQERINSEERIFAFEINGKEVFAKGGNWSPVDAIYARVTDESYNKLLTEARKANYNMLRVNGVGIYERDYFHEKCDEYGIMVWQDFMFSVALYPDEFDWFRNEVANEINYQTRRLRNHASLTLWCGCNETMWSYTSQLIDPKLSQYFGGLYCYNILFPTIIRNNCPQIPYLNCSPYGGEEPNGTKIGDEHHWLEWGLNPEINKRAVVEKYDGICSKFISEFGYLGPAAKSSVIKYFGNAPVEMDGDIWKIHNNIAENGTVIEGIKRHYGAIGKNDLDNFILYGGLCQGTILGYAYSSMRIADNCSGSLLWSYNQSFGEVGWSIIDYYLKRKISYYFVKRALAHVSLVIRESNGTVNVFGINDTLEVVCLELEYGYISFDGKQRDTNRSGIIKLEPNSKKIILSFAKPEKDYLSGVCYAKPESDNYEVLAAILRSSDFKQLKMSKAKIEVTGFVLEENCAKFVVSSDYYAHAVHFNLGDDVELSDDYFDLLPGESREITVCRAPEGFSLNNVGAECVIPLSCNKGV